MGVRSPGSTAHSRGARLRHSAGLLMCHVLMPRLQPRRRQRRRPAASHDCGGPTTHRGRMNGRWGGRASNSGIAPVHVASCSAASAAPARRCGTCAHTRTGALSWGIIQGVSAENRAMAELGGWRNSCRRRCRDARSPCAAETHGTCRPHRCSAGGTHAATAAAAVCGHLLQLHLVMRVGMRHASSSRSSRGAGLARQAANTCSECVQLRRGLRTRQTPARSCARRCGCTCTCTCTDTCRRPSTCGAQGRRESAQVSARVSACCCSRLAAGRARRRGPRLKCRAGTAGTAAASAAARRWCSRFRLAGSDPGRDHAGAGPDAATASAARSADATAAARAQVVSAHLQNALIGRGGASARRREARHWAHDDLRLVCVVDPSSVRCAMQCPVRHIDAGAAAASAPVGTRSRSSGGTANADKRCTPRGAEPPGAVPAGPAHRGGVCLRGQRLRGGVQQDRT